MILYFVRHGEPDYANDCLTGLGHKQAEAAAWRLRNSGIERIFASPMGRALQTAEYTAKQLGLEVTCCDFMREIATASLDGEPLLGHGSPWLLADIYAAAGKSLRDVDWQKNDPYCKSKTVKSVEAVITGFDAWLAELGYQRDGEYYRVTSEDTDKTIAIFSHGGSSSAVLSHMFNIPFPQFCGAFPIDFTSITIVQLGNKIGERIYPQMLLVDDAEHIKGLSAESL